MERGFIKVDAMMRTGRAGHLRHRRHGETQALAHAASHEGILAVEHMAGKDPHPINYDRSRPAPTATPRSPVGLTEAEGQEAGLRREGRQVPLLRHRKATILGETAGFVKIVADKKYDEVLGVHIIGPHATELIAEATAALSLEATAELPVPDRARPPHAGRGHG